MLKLREFKTAYMTHNPYSLARSFYGVRHDDTKVELTPTEYSRLDGYIRLREFVRIIEYERNTSGRV